MCYLVAMRQRLIYKKDFALLAGVSGAAITKASARGQPLAPAIVGRRIDAAHAVSQEYIAKKRVVESESDGRDPLYDQVLEFCIDLGRFTQRTITTRFGIGQPRSRRILEAFRVDGLLPEPRKGGTVEPKKPKPKKLKPKPKPKPKPKAPAGGVGSGNRSSNPRGPAAAKAKRIAETPADEEIFEIPENILAFADMTLREIVDKFGTDQRFLDFLNAVRRIEEIHERRLKSATKEGELVSRELVQKGIIDVFNTAHLRLLTDGAKTLSVGVISKHASGANEVEIELYVAEIIGSFIRPVKKQIARTLRGT